jgi:hypothetical protein
MSAATEVIGFVIDAILKIVPGSTGSLRSISRKPKQVVWTDPFFQTRVAAPASCPESTICRKESLIMYVYYKINML